MILALLLAWGTAAAQQPPTIALGSYSYEVGDTLTFSAANLTPNVNYRLELEPPAGALDDAEMQTATVRTDANGQLSYSAVLEHSGTYVLSIAGPRIDASLNVPVVGPPPARSTTRTPQQPAAQEPATEPSQEPSQEPSTRPSEEPSTTPETEPAPSDEGPSPSEEGDQSEASEAEATTEPSEEPATQPSEEPAAEPSEETETAPPGAPTVEEAPSTAEPSTPAPEPSITPAPDSSTPEPSTTTPSTSEPSTTTPGVGTPEGTITPPSQPGTITTPVGNLRLDGAAIVAGDPSVDGWRLDFPDDSGVTAGVAIAGDRLLVGHGNSVLTIDPSSGVVRSRARLPAQVTDITFSGGVALVDVRYFSGAEQQVRLLSTGPERLLPFDPYVPLYSWLRNEARVPDPEARLKQDPTNPFLYLAVATAAPGNAEQRNSGNLLEEAHDHAVTFYERAQLAESLLTFTPPRQDLAASAMDGALHDFVARGYRPELLTDQDLANAYGFPLKPLLSSLGRGDLIQAGFWADWVYRIATPTVPETQAALKEYATYLQQNGQRDDAALWRKRAGEGGGFDIVATLEDGARTVGRTGWYGVAALLVAIVALHLTLLAKYWRPQTLQLKRRRASGKSVSGASRLFFMHYATVVEKLVVVLLFAAALALAALQGWAATGDAVTVAWGSGSLATPPALETVANLDGSNPEALFVRGYALQSSGDAATAEAAYLELPDNAAAQNNLGVLKDDPSLYQRALELKPRASSAAFNLGEESNPSTLLAKYQPDEPAVVVPDQRQLRSAVAGSYLATLGAAFTNPWSALTEVPGVAMAHWLWLVLIVLFLLWAVLSILSLFWWQPRLARNAPRTLFYHLLALLLPGTGMADEFWGVFLSVPWAIFGVDLILHYLPSAPDPVIALRTDIIALAVIYVLNLVAFA